MNYSTSIQQNTAYVMSKVKLTFLISEEEMATLKRFCQQEERTQTDVIREYLRTLKQKVGTDARDRSDISRLG